MSEARVGVVVADEVKDDDNEAASQPRSKSGSVDSVAPTIPKLGLGMSGSASHSVYHQMLTPSSFSSKNTGQPTSFQYRSALPTDGTEAPTVFPLTGWPVSAIHTGFLPAALRVLSRACSKSEELWLISFGT